MVEPKRWSASIIAGMAALAAIPAYGAERLVAFVFAPAAASPVLGPCGAGSARDVHTLVLKGEYTSAPGLPPVMTWCSAPERAVAPAASPGVVVGLYRRLGRRLGSTAPARARSGAKPYEMVVLSDPVRGREREYGRWYDHDHIPAILRDPEFHAAWRFELISSNQPLPHYAAVYDFTSPDWSATAAEIRRRLATGDIPKSAAFNYATSVSRYYAR